MKHSILSFFAGIVALTGWMLCPTQMSAQRLRIHCGAVTYVTSAQAAGQVTLADGETSLRLNETSFAVNTIDSITTDRLAYDPLAVSVTYSGQGARLIVPCYLADRLNVTVDGGHVSILQDATLLEEVSYTLDGTSTDGSFFTDGEFKATLCLRNLTLTNPSGAAINVENGKRIRIILPEGTTTTLADGEGGLQKACFFVNGHAEFEGAGTLLLSGNACHAYASDEYTLFKPGFGTLQVTKSVGDGLHIEQYLQTQGGKFILRNVQKDCIDVSITKDPLDLLNGQVLIEGGEFDLEVAADDTKGIKCDSLMTVSGGTITAKVSGLGTKGMSAGTDLLISQPTSTPTLVNMTVTGTTYMPGDALLESKCRGIKVKGDFTFDGGTIRISATGVKSKAISVDGDYTYKSGSINCPVDAANM